MDGLLGGAGAKAFETWAGFSVIGTLSFVLGFAMNYGSICTFIATTELVSERRPARFLALAECAVWAAVGYIVLDTLPAMQSGWSPLLHMVGAAILFGVGVYVTVLASSDRSGILATGNWSSASRSSEFWSSSPSMQYSNSARIQCQSALHRRLRWKLCWWFCPQFSF